MLTSWAADAGTTLASTAADRPITSNHRRNVKSSFAVRAGDALGSPPLLSGGQLGCHSKG